MRKFSFSWMIAMACLVIASQAWAASSVGSLLVTSKPNQFSDEDREYLIDRTCGISCTNAATGKGTINVGDSFRGLLNINTLNATSANVGGGTSTDELTGVFQVKVTAMMDFVVPGFPQFSTTAYTFGPDPDFTALYGAGAVVALFTDTTHDFAADFDDEPPAAAPPADTDTNRANGPCDDGTGTGVNKCTTNTQPRSIPPKSEDVSKGPYVTEEGFIATAMNGTPFLTLGFLSLPGELIAGTTRGVNHSVLPFFTNDSSQILATFTLGLNVISYGASFPSTLKISRTSFTLLDPVNPVDISITESLKGIQNLDTPFEVASNIDGVFRVTSTVPEPSTVLLFGAGLIGVGIMARRRKK